MEIDVHALVIFYHFFKSLFSFFYRQALKGSEYWGNFKWKCLPLELGNGLESCMQMCI
jgi:hypothetical protein